MPYLTTSGNMAFTHGSITEIAEFDPLQIIEQIDWAPPRNGVASFNPEAPRAGGRRGVFTGYNVRIRGQEGSGSAWQTDDLVRASGMVRSGTTVYTYALGNIHASTHTPAGDLVLGSSAALFLDGIKYPIGTFCCNMRMLFEAGMFPTASFDFEAQIANGDITPTTASEAAASVPSLSSTNAAACAPWANSTISITDGVTSSWMGPIESLAVDLGNVFGPRKSPATESGYTEPDVVARNPRAVVTFERMAKATYALEDNVRAGTAYTLAWTHEMPTGVAGNKLSFELTGKAYEMPPRVDVRGNLHYQLGLQLSAFGWVHSTT